MSDARERDARAREAAQTRFDAPLLLEAGAGTGKTAVLVARVVAWALGPGWDRSARLAAEGGRPEGPEDLAAETLRRTVAITFTEAAAAEMGARVGEALLAIGRGELPVGVSESALPPEPTRAPRALALVSCLDQLTARTIHAFCRRLLAEHPLAAGVHPGFEVDASGERRAEVVREVIEEWLPEVFGHDPDADSLRLAEAGIGTARLEQALIRLIEDAVRPEDLDDDPLAPERVSAFGDALVRALGEFCDLEGGRLAGLGRSASRVSASMSALGDLCAALRARPARDAADLAWMVSQVRPACEAGAVKQLRAIESGDLGKGSARALGADAGLLGERAARLRPMLEYASKLEPRLLAAALRVLRDLLARAQRRLHREGAESFESLLRSARDLLVQHPPVAARLRRQLDQLLVDEFQDTDPLQCELLEVLALQGDAGERPGLFLVGDPKQSIYGWRRADLRAYHAFCGRVVACGGEVLPLVVNYRSVPAILSEVERLIGPVMQPLPGLQPEFQPLLPSPSNQGSLGFQEEGRAPVEHWISRVFDPVAGEIRAAGRANEVAELEARMLARDLQRLRACGVALRDVGLLLRSRTHLNAYLAALREAGIPYAVAREPGPGSQRELAEAGALVRAVLDPHDLLALVAVMRAPFVGVPDAALAPLWAAGLPACAAALGSGRAGALAEALLVVEQGSRSVPAGVPRLEALAGWEENLRGLLAALDELRALVRHSDPARLVERLRELLPAQAVEAARFLGGHRVARLEQFFRRLVGALDEGGGSPTAVARRLRGADSLISDEEVQRPPATDADAVQVMTIHAAKGLDFDHVYLLGTHSSSSGKDKNRVTWHEGHMECVLLDQRSPGFLAVEREQERRSRCERARLLYVAVTRARRRLVVAGVRSLGAPVDLQRASTLAHLLEHRRPAGDPAEPDLVAACRGGSSELRDASGVLWRLGDPADRPRPAAPATALPLGQGRAAEDARAIASARRWAQQRAARPLTRAASAEERAREGASDRVAGEGVPLGTTERAAALAAGTAVHAVLEQLDAKASDAAWRAALEQQLGADAPAEARERAMTALERFLAGPLRPRLLDLEEHVVARELPMLLTPEAPAPGEEVGTDAPVGCFVGAIDLLYRDPGDGRLVVADYKTDAVADEALVGRAADYAGQGAIYCRAVQRALELPYRPRFELWFLQAGRVVSPSDGP